MKRSPIAPTSKKRVALLRERRKLTDAMKREGPVLCEFVEWVYYDFSEMHHPEKCWRRADDLHEIVSRARGGSVTDPENTIPLCREHHRWVTEHPLEATELGLLRRKQ